MLKRILFQFNKIREVGSFARNVSITSTWNILGILSQFILSPVITRLYAPDQYGSFAIFNTMVVNAVLISNLRYSEAIVVTEGKQQRNSVIFLSFVLVLVTVVASSVVTILFQDQIQAFIGVQWPGYFLYIIPVAIFFGGTVEILLIVNVWRRKFFNNGLAGFLTNLLSRSFTICYALFFPAKTAGLVTGDLVGKIVGIAGILISFRNLKSTVITFFESVSVSGIRVSARLYRHFPLYTLPTNLLILFSGHLPIYFFQIQFTSGVVGYYALSSSLLEMINRLIPYSIAGVFLPKAMDLKRISMQHLKETVFKLYVIITILSVVIFSGFAIFSKYLFPWVFGASWKTAGIFMGILALQYSFHFISISLAEIYKVIGKQRYLLKITVLSVILKVLVVCLSVYFNANVINAILGFCLAGAVGSIIQILVIFIIFDYKQYQVSLSLLAMMTLFVLLTYFVNF